MIVNMQSLLRGARDCLLPLTEQDIWLGSGILQPDRPCEMMAPPGNQAWQSLGLGLSRTMR
jgi:hypothetical protein